MDYLQYDILERDMKGDLVTVLNLIINGLSSILLVNTELLSNIIMTVLNLIINGLSSIQV